VYTANSVECSSENHSSSYSSTSSNSDRVVVVV